MMSAYQRHSSLNDILRSVVVSQPFVAIHNDFVDTSDANSDPKHEDNQKCVGPCKNKAVSLYERSFLYAGGEDAKKLYVQFVKKHTGTKRGFCFPPLMASSFDADAASYHSATTDLGQKKGSRPTMARGTIFNRFPEKGKRKKAFYSEFEMKFSSMDREKSIRKARKENTKVCVSTTSGTRHRSQQDQPPHHHHTSSRVRRLDPAVPAAACARRPRVSDQCLALAPHV